MKTYIEEIRGKIVEFEGNKPIRVLYGDKEAAIRYMASTEYKASKMSFNELLDAYTEAVLKTPYAEYWSKQALIYLHELKRRGNGL